MLVPELRQLRYVIEVAQAGSLTRAAERLHVAQQAISQQVKAVEAQIGVKLFVRGNRGVELTPAGSIFVQEARKTVAASERLVRRTQAAARGEEGSLRIAYTLSTAYETLPAIFTALRTAAPDLRIEQREMTAVDLEDALLQGRQDAAICPRMALPPSLGRLEIRREPFVAALAKTHALATRTAITLIDLSDEEFQLWPRSLTPGYYDAVVSACRDAGFEPRIGDATSGATVWGNLANGRGVGLVVGSFAEQAPRGIVLIPLHDPAPVLIFDLIWANDHDSRTLQRLRDAVAVAASEWSRAATAAGSTLSSTV